MTIFIVVATNKFITSSINHTETCFIRSQDNIYYFYIYILYNKQNKMYILYIKQNKTRHLWKMEDITSYTLLLKRYKLSGNIWQNLHSLCKYYIFITSNLSWRKYFNAKLMTFSWAAQEVLNSSLLFNLHYSELTNKIYLWNKLSLEYTCRKWYIISISRIKGVTELYNYL